MDIAIYILNLGEISTNGIATDFKLNTAKFNMTRLILN